MESSREIRHPNSFWFKSATILTAVVLGLLSASAAQAALIVGESGSWFGIGGTRAVFWIGNGTPAWLSLGLPPASMQGATWGYEIMVVMLPLIIAIVLVLLSFRFLRGKGWLAILQILTVGLLAFWLVQVLLRLIFG